jgi:hypothetical protein
MRHDKIKIRLKKRGDELYYRYFYNSTDIIYTVLENYDNNLPINDLDCEVIFDFSLDYKEKIYELILFYPNLIAEHKIITKDVLDNIYSKYGETISIMKKYKNSSNNKTTVRSRLQKYAYSRAYEKGLEFNLNSEDIILPRNCPLLNVPLDYGISVANDFSPSIDRIDSSKSYIKDNIQVMSFLGNRMKNSATPEQLLTFANNIISLYGSK